jgi:hypothetical protein
MVDDKPQPDMPDDEFRPIPDGGLGEAMPDWLKSRPAWANETPARQIPEPDTSPIDPRALVREEDLPGWLLAISQRQRESAAATMIVEEAPILPPVEAEILPHREPVQEQAETGVSESLPVRDYEADDVPPVPIDATESPGWLQQHQDPVLVALIVLAIVIVLSATYLLSQ